MKGTCRLCGAEDVKLTIDHIQPQCAFNEKHRRFVRMDSVAGQRLKKQPPRLDPSYLNIYHEIDPDRPIHGGIYERTQCRECNGFLGSHYDGRFGEWCREALALLKMGDLVLVRRTYAQPCRSPLAIIKRVSAMFLSINTSGLMRGRADLSGFVRDLRSCELPPCFKFYAGYSIGEIVSHIPLQVRANVRTGHTIHLSQITHPPLVFVMTIESGLPDPRLVDITSFSKLQDGEESPALPMRILPTNSCFAGDYRMSGKLVEDDIVVTLTKELPSYYRLVDPVV